MLRGLAVLIAGAVFSTGTASGTELNHCVIEVDGHVYLDAPCNVENDADTGVITFGVGDHQSSPYFAYVMDDGLRAFWNGKDGDSHAHDDLGVVTLSGQCWQNASAKICAYDAAN